MSYFDQATDLIKLHEGFAKHPYRDSLGHLSVGYGRALEKNPLTREEAEYLLSNDLTESLEYCSTLSFWPDLNDTRKAVLLDMAFNLGNSGLSKFKKFYAALNAQDYEEASREMLDSLWATQVGKRGTNLARLMRRGHFNEH